MVHLLFKSSPTSEDQAFPITTPSTLIMGTNLKTNVFRTLSYFDSCEINASIISFIIKEEWVSAACNLAYMNTTCLLDIYLELELPRPVIVRQ